MAGYLQQQARLWGDTSFNPPAQNVNISDGAIIRVIKITEHLYNAYIDVRGVTSDPIIKAIQYQFVYTGPAGTLWDVDQSGGLARTGGSAVGVIFVVRRNSVAHAAFPLVSTLKEPNVLTDEDWLFIDDMSVDSSAWIESLIVPRYEVVHASSQHMLQLDDATVHAPWVKKGDRHYLALSFCPGGLSQKGTLFSTGVALSGQTGLSFFDSPDRSENATDVGYEVNLNVFNDVEFTAAELNAEELNIKLGSMDRSAPDADWYTSYGLQEVEHPDGTTRRYGILIDAAQRLYVWPLDAAGTGSPNPAYAAQLIKTNVDDQYVEFVDLQFPPDVFTSSLSYRDTFTSFSDDFFTGGAYKDSARYVWFPRRDGKEFCTIVERHADLNQAVDLQLPPGNQLGVPTFIDGAEWRVPDPAPAKFSVAISATGTDLEDFTINVSPVELVNTPDTFVPVQAQYSSENSFIGAQQDDLLVGGFSVYRRSNSVDSWAGTQKLNDLEPYNAGTWQRSHSAVFSCSSIVAAGLPIGIEGVGAYYVDLANGSQWNSVTGVAIDANFHYNPHMPLYMAVDMPFVRLGVLPNPTRTNGQPFAPGFTEAQEQIESFILEAEFKVIKEDQSEVFSVCCKKYKPNEFDFGNFFTATVTDLELSRGAIIFGLCDSTTWVSGVTSPATQWPTPDGRLTSDHRGSVGTCTANKGYAIYRNGFLLDTNDEALHSQLFTQLDSILLSKYYSTWGTLNASGSSIVPGSSLGLVPYFSNPLNAEFLDGLITAGTISSFSVSLLTVGVPEYPFGLDMYSWICANHYPQNASSSLLVEDRVPFTSFYGSYADFVKPIVVDCLNHQLQTDPEVTHQIIDVIDVAGQRFTHSALYQEAFGEAAVEDLDVRAESIFRGHSMDPRPPAQWEYDEVPPQFQGGYPLKVESAVPDVNSNYTEENKVFAPYLSYYADDERLMSINMLMPQLRSYCNLHKPPNLQWPAYSELDPEPQGRGAFRPVFLARAFAPIKIDTEE